MKRTEISGLAARCAWVLLAGSASTLTLADTLYKCVEPSGSVLYTNQKTSAKNCIVLSRELPISTVAAPVPRPAGASRSGSAAASPSPANFPRVDGETQRGRDNDRRRILEQELESEQQNLEKARKALAEAEAANSPPQKAGDLREGVKVHERNVEALKRELANVK